MEFDRRAYIKLARTIEETLRHSEIDQLAKLYELEDFIEGVNKTDRSTSLVGEVESRVNSSSHNLNLKSFVEDYFTYLSEHQFSNVESLKKFINLLESYGYCVKDKKLLEINPGPISVVEEISEIEAKLAGLGLNVALTHFQQAIDNYSIPNFESCNSQIRSFLEDFFIEITKIKTEQEFSNPNSALQHLKNENLISGDEWNLARSLYSISCSNGSHRGLSNKEESLFRLHFSTSFAQFLIKILDI
ncbi:MAG TPA: hypothetical protein VF181_12975 [Balneolaceae bacterium]